VNWPTAQDNTPKHRYTLHSERHIGTTIQNTYYDYNIISNAYCAQSGSGRSFFSLLQGANYFRGDFKALLVTSVFAGKSLSHLFIYSCGVRFVVASSSATMKGTAGLFCFSRKAQVK
jgi:hypothetical protein